MKTRLTAAVVAGALAALWAGSAAAQDILLGYLPAGAGPFATFSKTNEIAGADRDRRDQRRRRHRRQEASHRVVRHRRQARPGGGRPAQARRGRQGAGHHRPVQLERVPRGVPGRRPRRRRHHVDGVLGAEARRAVHLRVPQHVGRGLHVRARDARAQAEEPADRHRGGRLRDRRRDLEGHGRGRAAGHHEEVRHRREAQRHLPDPGVRFLRPGLATGRPADRPGRCRIGSGAGDAAGAGNAPAGPQGPARRRLDHRRSRARPADGQGRGRHHHSRPRSTPTSTTAPRRSRPSSPSAPRRRASTAARRRSSTPRPTTSCCSTRMR